jgi:hypothetical protein
VIRLPPSFSSIGAPVPAFPRVPVYLFYGNKVDDILRARDAVLDMLLDREARHESLTEYQSGGQTWGIEMNKVLPDVAGDLSTLSFIPGAQKVAIVTNPLELYASGAARPAKRPAKKAAAKKSAKAAAAPKSDGQEYLRWIEKDLKETGNHLILLAFEDESAGREVNDHHPIFQTVGRMGHFQKFRDTKAFWRIEDGLLGRNPEACLAAIEDLWKPGKGDANVYGAVVRCLRFMLQANIGREKGVGGDAAKQALYFPSRGQFSLYRAGDFVQKKYTGRVMPYRTGALLEAYEELLGVYHALRPRPGEVYVADARLLLENALLKLFASPRPPRA